MKRRRGNPAAFGCLASLRWHYPGQVQAVGSRAATLSARFPELPLDCKPKVPFQLIVRNPSLPLALPLDFRRFSALHQSAGGLKLGEVFQVVLSQIAGVRQGLFPDPAEGGQVTGEVAGLRVRS